MSREVSRRTFLRGSLAAAAAVVGFDTVLRGWVSAAELTRGHFALAESFPSFDGSLLMDGASLAAAADDFGHMIHRQPSAVLKPGSVNDVVKMVRFARRNRIRVAARGQGHSTQGQSQVEAGGGGDMATRTAGREGNASGALLEGGARWIGLPAQTGRRGRTPPTLVDFLELRVGGTLSLGGI